MTGAQSFVFETIKTDFLIISDMRFPCEADYIKSLGGFVVKIVRPSVPHTSDEADDPLLNYAGWSDIIINDADLNHLYNRVATIITKIF